MQHPESPWPPHIGDRVRIKGTRLDGIVHRINGERTERRFVLTVYARVMGEGVDDLDGASETAAARTVYWLDEIEPGL